MAVEKSIVDRQIENLGDFDKYFTKKERNYLHEVLSPGEVIRAMTSGMVDGSTWLITITEKRVLFLDKGMLYGLKQLEILIPQISTVSHKVGMMFGEIEITASGDSKKIEMIEKKDVPKVSNIISNLMRESKEEGNRANNAVTSGQDDVVSKLERLAALKEKGILDEDELKIQKLKILAE